jgi:hypothetical protein
VYLLKTNFFLNKIFAHHLISLPHERKSWPNDLPSIEMALLKLAAAMKALEDLKLTKTGVMRLRTLIQTSTICQRRFAEYVGYRRIERKLVEMDDFFVRLKRLNKK